MRDLQRPVPAAIRCLDAVAPLGSPDADLVALAAWACLHLAKRDRGQRLRATAELEHLLGLAVRRDEGRIGWGLGWAWDAFGDGTINPPDAVYAYQRALAGLVLCDAHRVLGEERWAAAAQEATAMLMTDLWGWQDSARGGEYRSVWYSDQRADQLPHLQKHDVNALTAGLLGRLGSRPPLYEERLKAMLGHLLACQGVGLRAETGLTTNWRGGSTGVVLERPNDLVHQVLIVIGLANVGKACATRATETTLDDLITVHFEADGTPREGVFTRGTRGWGPPAALFVLAARKYRSLHVRRLASGLCSSIDDDGMSSYAGADEPRAQVWYALALARWARGPIDAARPLARWTR